MPGPPGLLVGGVQLAEPTPKLPPGEPPACNPETTETHGKSDHFPLVLEDSRWTSPDSACREDPALLDPTDPEDPALLTFAIDGRVAVSPYYSGDAVAVSHVDASRIYLHLDWPTFVEERRVVYGTVYAYALKGDRAEEAYLRNDGGAKETLKDVAKCLIRMTGDHQPYSRAATSYIWTLRDRWWIKQLYFLTFQVR